MNDMAPATLTIKELDRRLRAEFPEMFHARSGYVIEELWHGGCRSGNISTQARCVRAARFPARP
jgi:hypothetical protein